MALFGAHMSISGGYFKAVEEAASYGFDCVQLFVSQPRQWPCKPVQVLTKNNNQWAAKPITEEDCLKCQQSLQRTGIQRPLSHASYLIN